MSDVLKKIDMEFAYDYTGYALDHVNMKSQEYHEDIDGNIDHARYKSMKKRSQHLSFKTV